MITSDAPREGGRGHVNFLAESWFGGPWCSWFSDRSSAHIFLLGLGTVFLGSTGCRVSCALTFCGCDNTTVVADLNKREPRVHHCRAGSLCVPLGIDCPTGPCSHSTRTGRPANLMADSPPRIRPLPSVRLWRTWCARVWRRCARA